MNGVRAKVVERASDPVARFILIEGVRISGSSIEEVSVKKTAGEHWLGNDGWQPMPAHFRAHLLEHSDSILIRLEPELARQIPYGCGIEISVESLKLNLKLRWDKAVDLEQYKSPVTIDTKTAEALVQREPTKFAPTDQAGRSVDGALPLHLSSAPANDMGNDSLGMLSDNFVMSSSSNLVGVSEPPRPEVPRSEPIKRVEDDTPKFVPSAPEVAVKHHEAHGLDMASEPDGRPHGPNRSKSSAIMIFFLCFVVVLIGVVVFYLLHPSAPTTEAAPLVAENPVPRPSPTPSTTEPISGIDPPNATTSSPPSYTTVPPACNVPPITSRPPTAATFRVDLEIQQARSKLAEGKLAEAEAMLRKAVKTGNAKAALLLGEMQDPSIGTQSNSACAMGWYQYAEFLGIDTSSQRSKLGQWQRLH